MSSLDEIPHKSLTARLMGMVQTLNHDLERASEKTKTIQEELMKVRDERDEERKKWNALCDLRHCSSCQLRKVSTLEGLTFELCHDCCVRQDREKDLLQKVVILEKENTKWKECYAQLLQDPDKVYTK